MFSNLGTLQTEIIFIADFATSFCLNCGFCRPYSSGLYTMQRPQAKVFLKYQGAPWLVASGARSFRNTPTLRRYPNTKRHNSECVMISRHDKGDHANVTIPIEHERGDDASLFALQVCDTMDPTLEANLPEVQTITQATRIDRASKT